MISRFGLKDDIKDKKIKEEIERYKQVVKDYKENVGNKHEVMASIDAIKAKFSATMKVSSKATKNLDVKLKEWVSIFGYKELDDDLMLRAFKANQHDDMFGVDESIATKFKGNQKKMLEELKSYQREFIEFETGKIYDNAFEWRFEFPEVLDENGDYIGFDVVIGNPPYVFARENFTDSEKQHYNQYYQLTAYQINLYILFIEQSRNIMRQNAQFALIVPNNWLTINSAKTVREYVLENSLIKIVHFENKVFEDANVDTAVLMMEKHSNALQTDLYEYHNQEFVWVKHLNNQDILNGKDALINISALKDEGKSTLLNIIENQAKPLSEIADVKAGLMAYEMGKGNPAQTESMKKERIYHNTIQVDGTYLKYLDGNNVSRYELSWNGAYLKYGKNLAAPRGFELFSTPRILVRQIPAQPPYSIHACYTDEVLLNDRNSMNIVNITEHPLYVLALLNSRLMTYWFVHKFGKLSRGIFPQFKVNELGQFPIKITNTPQPYINLVDKILIAKNLDPKADTSALENQIDQMVYKLYELTYDEVKVIDPEFSLSPEEYEAVSVE